MHGLGNDFVVIDTRPGKLGGGVVIGPAEVIRIADRRTGVGCDQLILIEDASSDDVDAFMRIHNADGSEVKACGNATRCIGSILMTETGADRVQIRTGADLLVVEQSGDGLITVDMGNPRFGWEDVPLNAHADTLHVDLTRGPLSDPAVASMGNPHATFFVKNVEAIPLSELGPTLEVDPVFPEKANIGIAEIKAFDRIRLRVWERGVGITPACGTGACAAVANAVRRDLTAPRVTVEVDGGDLVIDWRADGRMSMTGPVQTTFTGTLSSGLWA
ncbi:MAG: diaminopimelate epimerase [Pseudomonadota bacterium]|nr:diaminopimelate epimerase [Pseudomonadota bacterium]